MHGMHVFATGTSSTQYWLSPTLSALVAVKVGPGMTLFVRADGVVPTTQRTFWGSDNGILQIEYTVPSVALRGLAGAEIRFF